ncbi:MAG TPA: hypothetical protein PLO54_06005 [Bacilli bacterium]|nr:hypothetical protein [Bacilli bacterium]
MAMVTAYLLNPDGTKSTVSVEIESQDGIYFKKTEYNTPVYVGDNVVWVKNYFETVASKVIETTGPTGRVFVTPAQKETLRRLNENLVDKLIWHAGDKMFYYLGGSNDQYETFLATIPWVENYITGSPGLGGLNLDNRLSTLEAIFDGIDDTDEIINKWHELEAFLSGITETKTLTGVISGAITSLKSGENVWYGTNIWSGESLFRNENGQGYIKFESKVASSQFSTLKLRYVGGMVGEIATVTIPHDNGTVALTKYVPSIQLGASFSGTPKAGDVWIRY